MRPRVLVVDDDVALQLLARAALERNGFEVDEATDGAAGLEAFSRVRPDVVLLDVNMPKADGFTVCSRIRLLPEGKNTAVMMMTGMDDDEAIHRAYEAGASDFVTKPLHWVLLGYRLRYVLRASRTQQELAAVLRSRNAELDHFAWALSHDLKTPLVSLQHMAGLLVDECSHEVGEEAQHYVGRISGIASDMATLISNALTLSRIGREDDPTEVVSVDDVVERVLARLGDPVRARGVKLARGALGEVWSTGTEMEQVFFNLIGNAVTYLGNSATPRIDIGKVEGDTSVEYYVRDNGIGIDQAYHGRIFEPFQRLKDVAAEGSGLGLAIVKKIVEARGGCVRVDSAVGAGSTFFFTWPHEAKAHETFSRDGIGGE